MRKDEWLDKIAKEVNNLESPVDGNLWSGIQSQIATPGAAASSSIWTSKLVSAILGTVAVGAAVTTLVLTMGPIADSETETRKEEPVLETKKLAEFVENDTESVVKDERERLKDNVNTEELSTSIEENNLPTYVQMSEETVDEVVAVGTDDVPRELPTASSLVNESKKKEDKPEYSSPPIVKKEKSEPSVKEQPKVQEKVAEVKIPVKKDPVKIDLINVFTPNGDGSNDRFILKTDGLEDVVIVIMDAKNTVVWRGTSNTDSWDGRDPGGYLVPKGNYIYYVTGKDSEGEMISKYQRLEIIY